LVQDKKIEILFRKRLLYHHKNDFCCIITGDESEINEYLFEINKDLEKKFPWIHRIDEYTVLEIIEIFKKKVKDAKWFLDIPEENLIEIFEKNKNLFKNFGCDIETFFTKCKIFHSKRVFSLDNHYKFILTETDIKNSIEFLSKNKVKEDNNYLNMYL